MKKIKKIWNWIKKIFTPTRIEPTVKPKESEVDLTGLTKGDIKKLKAQGKL